MTMFSESRGFRIVLGVAELILGLASIFAVANVFQQWRDDLPTSRQALFWTLVGVGYFAVGCMKHAFARLSGRTPDPHGVR